MGNNVSKAMQECKKSGSKRLTLDNCSLKDLPKNTFKEFPDLEYLSLNQNQLLHLPMNISTFKELEVLKIEENRMTSLPSSISSLIKLKEIDFVSNELREIPEDIEKLQKLTKVVFQNNRLKAVPEGIGNLPELKLLYLAENDITSLPSSIGNLSQLTILSLYENMLPEIPKEIGKLSSLTSLNVSSNKIAIIPPELGNLTDLVEFFIFNNKLTEIPNELGNLTALQILDVSENQIKIIPESIGECTELRQCNFAENELTEIPNSIGNCDQLEMLKFSHNKIAVLPTSFQELVDLKELHVEGNEIESLQSELDEVIENLLIFSTEGNPIHSKIGVPVISPGEFEEVVWVMLCAGGVFKKYNRKGKTVNRLVYLDHKTMRLQCRDAKRNRDERDSIPIDKLSEVHIGLKTATLKKYGKSFREDHYFSLVSPTVTLDLEANSPEVREEWVNMFKQTITYYKEHPVEYPEDSNPLSPRVTKKGPTRADDIGEVGKNKRMSILGGIATIGKKKKKRPSFETTSSSSLLDEPVSLSGPSTDDEESDSQSLDPSTTSPEASPRDEGASPEMARSSSKKRLKTKTKSKKNVRKEKRTKKSKLATEVTTEEDLKESGEIDKQPEPTTPKGKDTTPAKEESKEPEPKEKDAAPAKEESKEPEKEELKEPEKEEPKQPEKEEPKQPEKKEEVVVASSPKEDQEERRIKHPEVEVKATKTPEVQAETKPASPAGPTRSKVAPKASILSRVSMFEQPKEEPAPVVKRSPARPVSMYKPAEPASPVASASPTRAVKPDVRPVSLAPGEVERPADIVEIKKTYGGQTSAGNVRNRLAMFETIEQKAQREAAILQGKRLEEQKAKDAAAAAAAGKPAEDKQPSKDAETKAKEDADNKAKEEADKKAKEEADRKAKEEADRKAKEEADRKAKEEADRKAKEEADRKAKEEADKKAKEEADRKAKEEADRKAKEEADRKAKEEADRKAKEEADKKAKEEAERKAKEEAERKAKEEEERKKLKTEEEKRAFEERTRKEREEREAKEEAERKAKEEADRKAKEEADRKAKEEADRKAKEEAERKAKEEAERKAKEEADRKAKEEADRKAKEEADRKAKEEADKKAKEEADRKAKEEAERKAKEEAGRKAKEEADKKVKEAAERKAKEEADKKAKEAADKKAKEEADKKAKEEADKKAKEEADKKAKEEADKKAKEAADKKTTEAVKAEEEEGEDEGQEEGDDEESRTPKIIKRAGGVTGRRLPTRKGGGKLATEAANRLQEAEEKRKQQLEEIARRREENMKLLEEEEAKLAQLSPAERQALEEKEKEEEKRKEEEEYAERVAREEKEREIQKKMELEKQKVQAIQGALGSLKKAEARKRVEPSSRLIMLKGKRRVRVHLVEVSVKSMNQGDVFILDKKTNLYIWNGKKANRMEKAKAAELTLRFKNQERKGANIVRVEPGDTEEEFWKELGGTEADIRSAEDGGGDIEYERECDANVKLWRVERNEDGDGDEYSLSEVDTKRLSRETLATEGCFILDCKTELFVWVGKGSTSAMRSFTMNYAKENLLESRPDWTHFSRNVEGGEEILFREKFAEWPDIVPGTRGSSGGSSSGGGKQMVRRRSMLMGRIKKKEVKIDVNKLHTAVRTEQELLGDGTLGTIEAWIGVDGKLEEEKDLLDGHFYSAESYVILYTFHKGNAFRYHIYFWQGLDATKQDKGLTALLVKEIQVKVQKEKGAEPFQERVTPLKEPYQLLTIFKGKFIVHKGKKTDHMKSKDNHLYRIQSTIDAVYTRCTEIPANASLMNSRDTFVVQTSSKQYIWCGTGTSEEQKQRAIELAQHMQGTRSVKVMDEGSEDKKFWKLIGGKKTYANASFLKKKGWEPRFYYCTGAGNDFKVEPVWEVIQSDLDLTGAMIVDVIAEVYVWTGPSTPEETKKKAMETATEYVRAAFDGRLQNTPIYFVASGQESSAFISLFPSWSDKGNRGEGKMELVSDKLKDYDREYTWDELTAKDKPKGLDYKHLEKYLPDSVFEEKFGMTKEKFWSMPSWKRTQKKKKIGFF